MIGGVALLSGAVVGGLAGWNLKPSPRPTTQAVAKLTVPLGADEEMSSNLPAIAVSPNGTHSGVRRQASRSHSTLPAPAKQSGEPGAVGTEDARAPFFSPDSQWVGFFAEGKLKKIPVTGGASRLFPTLRTPLLAEAGHRTMSSIFRQGHALGFGRFLPGVALLSPSRPCNQERLVIDGRRSCQEGTPSCLRLARVPGLKSGRCRCSVCRAVNGA